MSSTATRQRWFRNGGSEMLKSGAVGLLVVSLAIFIYSAYHSYAVRQRNDGDVVGETGEGTTARRDAPPDPTGKQAVPPSASAGESSALTASPAAPATDSIAPDPPNGMSFGGSGHFQMYRQGNITWRLNTESGATCVLFATDAEWKNPRIRHSACHGSER